MPVFHRELSTGPGNGAHATHSRGGGDPVEPVQLAAARDLVCAPGPERREQRETRQGHRNDLDIARGGESIPERHAEPPEPQHQEEVTRLRHPVLAHSLADRHEKHDQRRQERDKEPTAVSIDPLGVGAITNRVHQ